MTLEMATSGKTRRADAADAPDAAWRRASTATTSPSCASCSTTRACPTPSWPRASACRPRRPGGACKWLEEQGYITGYRAEIDRRKIGLGVLAFVRVDAERNTADATRELEDAIRRLPEVIVLPLHHGPGTFELQVMATDLDAFSRFVARHAAQSAAT